MGKKKRTGNKGKSFLDRIETPEFITGVVILLFTLFVIFIISVLAVKELLDTDRLYDILKITIGIIIGGVGAKSVNKNG